MNDMLEQYGNCPNDWNLTPEEELVEELQNKLEDLENEKEELLDIIAENEREIKFFRQHAGNTLINLWETKYN